MPPLCKGRWRVAPEGLYPFGRAAQRRSYINGCHICHPYDFRNPPSLLPIGKGGLLSRALKRAAQRDVLSAKLHQTAKQAAKKSRSPEPLPILLQPLTYGAGERPLPSCCASLASHLPLNRSAPRASLGKALGIRSPTTPPSASQTPPLHRGGNEERGSGG